MKICRIIVMIFILITALGVISCSDDGGNIFRMPDGNPSGTQSPLFYRTHGSSVHDSVYLVNQGFKYNMNTGSMTYLYGDRKLPDNIDLINYSCLYEGRLYGWCIDGEAEFNYSEPYYIERDNLWATRDVYFSSKNFISYDLTTGNITTYIRIMQYNKGNSENQNMEAVYYDGSVYYLRYIPRDGKGQSEADYRNSLCRIDLKSGEESVICTSDRAGFLSAEPHLMFVSDGVAYFADGNLGKLFSLTLEGAEAKTLLPGDTYRAQCASGISLYAGYLYFPVYASDFDSEVSPHSTLYKLILYRIPASGGTPERISADKEYIRWFALTADGIICEKSYTEAAPSAHPIYRMSHDGGNPGLVCTVETDKTIFPMTLHGKYLYLDEDVTRLLRFDTSDGTYEFVGYPH